MFYALCRIEVFIPDGHSLKAKRSVIRRIRDRLRSRFHASVAEIEGQDLWQRGVLGAALVGTHATALEAGLAAMRRMIEEDPRCQIIGWDTRVEPFGAEEKRVGRSASDADEVPWDQAEEGDEFYGPVREDARGVDPPSRDHGG